MSGFKVGDWVECIDFGGSTGLLLSPSTPYSIKEIKREPSGRRIFTLCGVFDKSGDPLKAFEYRFHHYHHYDHFHSEPQLNEYEDILSAQDIYKSLIDG